MMVLSSCVPKSSDLGEAAQFSNKKGDRKIANDNNNNNNNNNNTINNENALSNFNALTVSMNVRIGDREYIQNVFIDIFGPASDNIVRPYILNQGTALNGGCSQYEATYADNVTINAALPIDDSRADCNLSIINLPVIGSENAIREGQRIQACEVVVNNATTLFYLIDKVTEVTNVQATFATNPTSTHIKKIYSKFYPAQEIPVEVLSGLTDIGASNALTTAKDRFKLIALTICMSADWQIP